MKYSLQVGEILEITKVLNQFSEDHEIEILILNYPNFRQEYAYKRIAGLNYRERSYSVVSLCKRAGSIFKGEK
jgi:hypothetical protein